MWTGPIEYGRAGCADRVESGGLQKVWRSPVKKRAKTRRDVLRHLRSNVASPFDR
jgi:hypothetical protein